MLGACAPPWSAAPSPTSEGAAGAGCAITSNTTHNANGHTLGGKRGGAMFIYPAADRIFKANLPQKMLVFLDRGTNYVFPDAGCWELRVGEPGSRDMVVIAVAP